MTQPGQRGGLRRLIGLDRSAPPPSSTLPGSPLRPWTLPNCVGYARLVGLALFVVFALRSGDGHSTVAAVLYGCVAWGDYLDGILARVTGQYSRLGAILDPIIDRLMIIAGAAVAWHFALLPHTLLALLLAREVAMLVLGRYALHRRGAISINWAGRLGVWPIMSSLFFAITGLLGLAHVLLVLGVVMAYVASVLYAWAIFARPPVIAGR
ncbi:MAG: CDP-alcohol phosphatidyltransferase family protein [Patulibacter sp.]